MKVQYWKCCIAVMKRKTNQSALYQKKNKKVHQGDSECSEYCFFSEVICYIHHANFGIQRLKIFQNQIRKYGGEILETLPDSSDAVSHIVFEESINVDKLKVLVDPSKYQNTRFVKCTWLIACGKAKDIVDTTLHEIIPHVDHLEETQTKKVPNTVTCGERKPEQERDHLHAGKVGVDSSLVDMQEENQLKKEDPTNSSENFDQSNLCMCPPDTDSKIIKKIEYSSGRQQINHEQIQTYCKQESGQNIAETENVSDLNTVPQLYPKKFQEKFVCARPSSSKVEDLNSHITVELEKLATAYKSKKDTWRALGYQKAISAIRNFPRKITSRDQAVGIPGVGKRLADKVAEIIESGKLRKVTEVCEGEEAETLKLFIGVWGAGPTTAQSWYTQGFRTLEDLHSKAVLTRHQQIGLKHYHDINSRIPRDEVTEIEEFVRSAALSIKKDLIVMVCGSYRRGKATCGDVDVLITHPDGCSHQNIFKYLLTHLREIGFLTDDLVSQEADGSQQKYLGVCKLPGKNRKHRRLDVIVVPYAEFAPAVMYFTGSAHFNRSMRLLATKMGMSLSEHGLRAGIVRQGREKLSDGHLLDTPTEESVFAHLGLEYRSPQERDH